MKRIESRLNTASADFQANAAHNRKLAQEFRAKQEAVRNQRPQRDIDRLRQQNKLLVRERLNLLLDAGADPHLADWWGRTALYLSADMRTRGGGAGGRPGAAAGPAGVRFSEAPGPSPRGSALQVMQRLLETL